MILVRLAVALLLAVVARPLHAAEADHGYQTWNSATIHGPVGSSRAARSLWVWTDAHVRLYERLAPSAVLVRPGLSFKASRSLFVTGGYAWTPSWRRTDLQFADEHRVWEQLMWTPRNEAVGAFAIVRARLEQRVRPGPSRDVGLRGRVMLRAHARIPAEPRLVVVLWQELFVGLTATDWGQPLGVDQTRSFLGVGWQLRPDTARLELGYTNVWAVRPGADAVAHVLAINGFFGWPSGA